MPSILLAYDRLVESAVVSLALLAAGVVAVLCCRQPVRRIRVIECTLAACLVAPVVALLPGLPRWSLARPEDSPARDGSRFASNQSVGNERARNAASLDQDPMPVQLAILSRVPGESGEDVVELADTPEELASRGLPGNGEHAGQMDSRTAGTGNHTGAGGEIDDSALSSTESGTLAVSPAGDADKLEAQGIVDRSGGLRPPLAGVQSDAAPLGVSVELRRYIVAGYTGGLAIMVAWWLTGLAGLVRLLRRARPAPAWCRALLREIAGPAGEGVRLVVSPAATQPFTFTWRRPVIVLPEVLLKSEISNFKSQIGGTGEAEDSGPADPRGAARGLARERTGPVTSPANDQSTVLRLCLAHEWSHVARHDTWVWSLAGFVRLVYYYQPLCWWLRRQLRLCQDYLADARAAREASPEDYAEFLATRALGRPVAVGLGIAGRKSDLYRRIAMLVQNSCPLESRCPRVWSAAATMIALVLIAAAATFATRSDRATADDAGALTAQRSAERREEPDTREKLAAPAEQDDPDALARNAPDASAESDADDPLVARATDKPGATDKLAARAADPETQKLIDGVLARSEAIKSGRFKFLVEITSAPSWSEEVEFVLSGNNWRRRRTDHPDMITAVMVNDGSRLLSLTGSAVGKGQPLSHELRVSSPKETDDLANLSAPLRAGTFWHRQTAAYVRQRAAEVRLRDQLEPNGERTRVLDLPVPKEEAKSAFFVTNPLLAGGGKLRVSVAPELGYALRRVECIDRFDTPQFVYEFQDFKEVAPGIHFPRQIRVQELRASGVVEITSVSDINQAIPDSEFVLPIPAGTHVLDRRPRRGPQRVYPLLGVKDAQEFDEASLRDFTTGVAYPNGLPAAMLAEMDEGVISPDEAAAAGAEGKAPPTKAGKPPLEKNATQPAEVTESQSPPGTAKGSAKRPTAPATHRSAYRYEGKSFDDWSNTLRTELGPDTRLKALRALGAFAANGYGDETAEVVASALKIDDASVNNGTVYQTACHVLAKCGDVAIPVFETLLDSPNPTRRNAVLEGLSILAEKSDAPVPLLLRLTHDRALQNEAFRTLVHWQLGTRGVLETVERAIEQENWGVRSSIVTGLSLSKAPSEMRLRLLLRLAKDEEQSIRMFTHSALLRFAANSEEAQSVLKRAISESERNVRWNLLTNLGGQGDHPDVDPDVAVSLLIAALESPGFYDGVGADVPNRAILALGNYGRKAKPAVPVLIMALQRRIPAADLNVMNRAAQALGKIGPGAKDAIPALQEARKAAVEAAGDRLQPGVYTDENANDEAALARACAAALKKIRSE